MQLLKQQAYCPRKPVRVFDQGRLLNEKLVALEHSGYIRKPMVRDLNKPTKPIFNFKKEDVNIVLYGYIRNEESSGALLHSLSGIMSSKLQSEGKNFFSFFRDDISCVMVDSSDCSSITKHYAHANITKMICSPYKLCSCYVISLPSKLTLIPMTLFNREMGPRS